MNSGQSQISRRRLLKLGSVAALTSILPGCADTPTATMTTPMSDEPNPMMGQVEIWEQMGILTPNEPGEWGEKIAGHFPIVYRKPGGVMVSVAHPMDPEHYIEGIYLKDGSGRVLGVQELTPDQMPSAFFELANVPADLEAFAVCNLHQVWSASLVRTPEAPGPWADKIAGHTPRISIEDGQATVQVLHPMTDEHAILAIYLSDQNDVVFAKTQLARTDEAKFQAELPSGVTEVRAWALCDDHDLWVNRPIDTVTASMIADWEAAGILTADEPGEWGGKIAGHYPIANILDNRVVVHTPHEMTPEHYIEAIYLKDADGFLVGCKKLSPGDWPAASFDVFDAQQEYMAFSVCNLHQVWAAPIVRDAERPGPWAEKVESHTPEAVVEPSANTVTVVVNHPMTADHRIVALYLTNENGDFVAKKQLQLEETTEATYTFELPPQVSQLTPWALCDDHDLWRGPTVSV